MSYSVLATSKTPALVVYVLDVSYSMNEALGGQRRIDAVTDALAKALRQMVFRSTKGTVIAPRYRVAMVAYSDHVWDLLDGAKTVDKVAKMGVPKLSVQQRTDTARAFTLVKRLLERELPNLQQCPAPVVCHMTDGHYTGDDPSTIINEIKQMRVPDGSVLMENVFISDQVLTEPITDPKRWQGVRPSTGLVDDYARQLRDMSSALPDSYRSAMEEAGYHVANDAVMMLPGANTELVEMGFVMSMGTPISAPARVEQTIDA